jgi:hypothetical protein
MRFCNFEVSSISKRVQLFEDIVKEQKKEGNISIYSLSLTI